MTELTSFQEKCGSSLRELLQTTGHEIRSWQVVAGRQEAFIEADLGPIRIWVYEDGACWQGLGRDRVYEAPDYGSLDDLQQAFLTDVIAALMPGG